MTNILIHSGNIRVKARLLDNKTGHAIKSILPITGRVNTWGDEIYFDVPAHVALARDAMADVNVGDLAFWPQGNAFCIFFGATPISVSDQPKAASPVNVFGKIEGDLDRLKAIQSGAEIIVSEVI